MFRVTATCVALMCARLGLDPKLLSSIFNMSTGRCWSSEVYNPVPGVVPGVPASNDYNGGFGTALMAKAFHCFDKILKLTCGAF